MSATRSRPAIFRALGRHEPPNAVTIDGSEYQLSECLKHDSWAATAVYIGAAGKVVCKFNRQQPIFVVPMKWLGRRLARREGAFLNLLADQTNVPRLCGPVYANGRRLENAVAHPWIEGHPLAVGEPVGDRFFPELQSLIAVIHSRGAAYVDLHKRENIIVADDGRPFLIDFQICYRSPPSAIVRAIMHPTLRFLQQSDTYHLMKHICRHRPDLLPEDQRDPDVHRPLANRVFRMFGNRFRATRRSLLVLIGVRKGRGFSHTEVDPEDCVRRELASRGAGEATSQ